MPLEKVQYIHPVIRWAIPEGFNVDDYDSVNIFYSYKESSGYTLLYTLPVRDANNNITDRYEDKKNFITSKDNIYYIVIYHNSVTDTSSEKILAFKETTPREQKLIYLLRDSLSKFISNKLVDEELRIYLESGLHSFNIIPPVTSFTVFNLPPNLEPLIVLSATLYGAMINMLQVSFTDINATDNGITLNIDRGSKVSNMIDKINSYYKDLVNTIKIEYAEGGQGVGSVPVPIGLAGNIGKSVMNIFDLLNALGR